MGETLTLPAHFRGPATTANGGYAAGAVAELLHGPAAVLLRRPPPLDRPLTVRRDGRRVEVLDGDELVLAGEPAEPFAVELPDVDWAAVPWSEDVVARLAVSHGAPTCVVCGPDRPDGLRVFPDQLSAGVVACRWRVPGGGLDTRELWAVLDCPGAWALLPPGEPREFFPALARMSVAERAPVEPGEEVVVAGWRTGEDGRRHHAATALVALDGAVRAAAVQTCVALPPDWASGGASP